MAKRVQMTKRLRTTCAIAAFASLLTACDANDVSNTGGNSDMLKMGQLVLEQVGLFGSGGGAVTRETAAAIPYASIGVRLGSGLESILVLATTTGAGENWQAGASVSVSTIAGRVVHTTGFPHNLDGFQGPIPDSQSMTPEQGGPYHYLYDMKDMGKYGLVVQCKQRDAGAERIVIIGVSHDTRHIIEDCSVEDLDWSFTNDFWRDAATGYVWKSVQNVRPDIDALTIETLRPEK
jgi:hypothetical protein